MRYERDPRAEGYLMRDHADLSAEPPASRRWQHGPILDQGREGACVGFGWTAWRNAEPVPGGLGDDYALRVYREAQLIDPWADTPPEAGTSVQAGAKIMEQDGAVGTYVWAKGFAEAKAFVGLYGPVVVGTVWREGMYRPDAQGYVTPTGGIVGGHCYLWLGYDATGDLWFQNSWGAGYGQNGLFRMREEAFRALLDGGHASLCSAAELAPDPPPEREPETVGYTALARQPKPLDRELRVTWRGRPFLDAKPPGGA